jgi:hypothetical protein
VQERREVDHHVSGNRRAFTRSVPESDDRATRTLGTADIVRNAG